MGKSKFGFFRISMFFIPIFNRTVDKNNPSVGLLNKVIILLSRLKILSKFHTQICISLKWLNTGQLVC